MTKAATDAIPAAPKAIKGVEEDAQVALAGYTVAVYSAYRPDSSQKHSIIDSVNLFTGNFIVVTNRATHAADTLSLDYMSFAHSPNISVKDITKAVGAHTLTFILTYQGDSDNDYCEVVRYVNGELTELFDDPQPGVSSRSKRRMPPRGLECRGMMQSTGGRNGPSRPH